MYFLMQTGKFLKFFFYKTIAMYVCCGLFLFDPLFIVFSICVG